MYINRTLTLLKSNKMVKLSTITTHEDAVDLARVYCIMNKVTMKDFVADVLKKELKEFKESLKKFSY